jgi:hypothetical protein
VTEKEKAKHKGASIGAVATQLRMVTISDPEYNIRHTSNREDAHSSLLADMREDFSQFAGAELMALCQVSTGSRAVIEGELERVSSERLRCEDPPYTHRCKS